MTKQTGSDALNLIKSLASGWSAGRGCTVEPSPGEKGKRELTAKDSGFLYRWNRDSGPVGITFLADRHPEVAANGFDHLLFIGSDDGNPSIQIPGHPPLVIKMGSESLNRKLEEILIEARSTDPQVDESLTIIIAAQRLVALVHDSHLHGPNGSKSPKASSRKRFANDLHDWLAGELENSVKLGDAARHFNKSPRQLIRVLKETTGTGFAEHLTMHRLILARTLLMRTDGSIMDVARQSGFNSREQFIRSFSKAFDWTPLQFRKAWNRAALSNSDLQELCRVSDRVPVSWLEPDQSCAKPSGADEGAPHTLVVANALHEIIELFSTDSNGRSTRTCVLDRGAMVFINRTTNGSCWRIHHAGNAFKRSFMTPDQHAVAVITPDLKP